jgi:hypothetical protein
LSAASRFFTGAVLVIEGGYTARQPGVLSSKVALLRMFPHQAGPFSAH